MVKTPANVVRDAAGLRSAPTIPSWVAPIARAIPAGVAAIIITFTPGHSAQLGLVVFGGFALITGAISVVALRALRPGLSRTIAAAQGAASLVAGGVALAVVVADVGADVGGADVAGLIAIVSSWAAVTGFLEVYVGVRTRGSSSSAKDSIFAGGLTALLAIVVVLVPPGLSQPFEGQNEVAGLVTASIIVVGAFGAYAAILTVYLVIAGLSLKWAPATEALDQKNGFTS